MKRRALIIYCDDTPSGPLTGTVRDAHNLNAFLKSLAGGEWRNDEVGFLRNPTDARVKTVVNSFMKNADYTFTVFSGHGFVDRSNKFKQYVELSNKSVPLRNLLSNAKRQTIIADACRGFYSAHRESLLEEYSSFIGDVEHLEQPSTRRFFDSAVKKADKGVSVLYSASLNETALDTPSGGAFLFSLLSYAQSWSSTKSHYTYLPHHTALTRAKKLMYEKFDTNQRPILNSTPRDFHFPLAVKFPTSPSWLNLR
jgi:hypothetical protein